MRGKLARTALLGVLGALGACGAKPDAPIPPAGSALQTLTVGAAGPAGGMLWDGVVQAVEQSVLSAQTSGRVVRLPADVDRRVARGELLLALTDVEQRAAVQSAEAQLRAAEAQLVDAAARYQRASELVGRQLISRDDYDRISAAHDSALANRDAAAAQLAQAREQLAYTAVGAPYAGVVAARHVELGETVTPGQPLFTLYAPGELRLEAELPQAEAEQVRAAPAAEVLLPDGRSVGAAKVIVYPSTDPSAHSTTVRVLLPALESPPRPGQTARLRFAAAATASTDIWLPATALVTRGELSAAYVVSEEGIVLRQLRLGRSEAGQVQVVAGLATGERVAVDPLAAMQALRASRASAAAAHE